MNISSQPHIEIWFDSIEYGYRIDLQDESMCEILETQLVTEGSSTTYANAVSTALSVIKSYAIKLKVRAGKLSRENY
ncbi:MAG: hypothetical protein CLLPBCKN_007663 [Chroococcidiopsis cubana SAG 39.79]|uniref:Uncharacterized protein n=1 Tax=Chroococcidiopsis cubana SAG 39.79 TaxID=388085 RepID=A0AB37USQ7_9CYAN|nr:hypothetical protein [Chroococcidiopsis cubana]MDZ4878228.1 hypothetical protein [Chroococcidiopsis cubana SAG 39.79]PSB54957.1 hypothetical protein C7B79_34150 [Chroococcidiopsis cubana CCALA 043]RUT14514.1 hypothetical protein DSM107010_00600 [Chroococcidiopsis cubana SAG 39.79]